MKITIQGIEMELSIFNDKTFYITKKENGKDFMLDCGHYEIEKKVNIKVP